MWPFTRKQKQHPGLWQVTPYDCLSMHQMYEGVFAIGGTGSGKTTTFSHLMLALMRRGGGMLFLTAKADDFQSIARLAAVAGRLDDLVRFAPGEQSRFNFLNHELTSDGGSIQAAGQLLQDLVDFGTHTNSMQTTEPFWTMMAARKLRMAMTVVFMAKGKCGIDDLYRFCITMPTIPSMVKPTKPEEVPLAEEWRKSFCAECLLEAQKKWPDDDDLALAGDFVLKEWVRLSGKTAGCVDAHLMNILEKFMHGSVRELIASDGTNITPEDVLTGKLLVIDMPILKYREPGQFVQMVWKLMVQRAVLRRVVTPESRDVVLWCDEAQLHALPSVDSMVQAVARSHRLVNVALTQNIPLLESVLKRREDVLAWISNLQTKFIFANGDKDTNEYFSAVLGNSKHLFGGMSMNTVPYDPVADYMGLDQQQGNYSMSEHWHPDVPPDAFTKLRKGGREYGYMVDAYVFQGGRRFSTGKTWVKAAFRQRV